MSKVISIVCQKGGTGKTTTAVHLGTGLARQHKRVLLIDADQQGSMSICMGYDEPTEINLATIMNDIINEA
jgi:chromosome partitioning protein